MADLRLTLKELRAGVDLATNQTHTITVVGGVDRVRLAGMFFDLEKCFLLPSAMRGIREIKTQYDAHPGANLLVVGHTDTAGKDAYNLTLSLERAKAVAAFLTDDVAAWEAYFADSKPAEKRWGLLESQHMLTVLPEGKTPYYRGTPNGKDDAASRAAVKAFQGDHKGLKDDGIAGPKTRKVLITAYMNLDHTSLPDGATLTTHGCGENFPAENTGDGKRLAENRRVEIFFFDGSITPPPPGPTSARGSTQYPTWCKQVVKTIDVTLGRSSSTAALQSRYALGCFEQFAAELDDNEFVAWASFTYGSDVPLDAYRKLREDLVGKTLVAPEIQLVPDGVDGKDGAYDDATQMIGVPEQLALAAETDTAAAGTLIVVLMHEFGHHIDHLLRNRYSQVGGDAPGEEGTQFSYAITAMHHLDTDHVPFATLTRNSQDVELALDFPDFKAAATKYLSDPQAQEDAKRGTVEFFGAGRGNPAFPKSSFGHRSIEDGLMVVGNNYFDKSARNHIYFGNWLRDFSQVNDPGWLRFLHNGFVNAVTKARDLMTEIVDLGAQRDFDPTVAPSEHRKGDFHVDRYKLGVYRPEQHMDNPRGIRDGSALDPDFHGKVLDAEIGIDPMTGLKAYITSRGRAFKAAADFIDDSLRKAYTAGRSVEGYRLFGQGLHTLEDTYAHSNFIELALIRLGCTQVYAWVGPSARLTVFRNGAPQVRIPMVTGTFAIVDFGVSVWSMLGEILQKPIECKAGEFSPASIALIKLLEAVTPKGAGAIESLYTQINKLERAYPDYATALCRVTSGPLSWLRGKFGAAIREQVSVLDRVEQEFFADPTSTNPTHSQLSKDHDDHPLHVIAAQCARSLVTDMGQAMMDAWGRNLSANDLVQRALRYLIHPDDVEFRVAPTPGPEQLIDQIQAFARANPAVIKQLDFATSKARFLGKAKQTLASQLDTANEMLARNDQNAKRTSELTAMA